MSAALLAVLCAPSGDAGSSVPSADAQHEVTRARDEAWLVQIRAQDESAFEALFRAYVEPLARYATSYLHDDEAAREIVSEVFLSIWQRRVVWSPEQGVAAYLYAAVRNRALNVIRADRRREAAVSAATLEPHPPALGSHDTAAEAEHAELLAKVRAAVATLPPARREAMVLRWDHGLAPDQIATVMGVTRGAVYHLLERSLQTLRELLAPDLP